MTSLTKNTRLQDTRMDPLHWNGSDEFYMCHTLTPRHLSAGDLL